MTKSQLQDRPRPELSDAELLTRQLKIYDPMSVENLVNYVPETEEVPEIESYFDRRGEEIDRFWCAVCQTFKEKAGCVMKTADGRRFLVGWVCARDRYGAASIDHMEKTLRDRERRQTLLRRLSLFHDHAQELKEWAVTVSLSKEAKAIARVVDRIKSREFSDLHKALSETRQNDGALVYREQVHDYEKEQKDQDRYDNQMRAYNATFSKAEMQRHDASDRPIPPRYPIYKYITRSTGSITGLGFLDQPNELRDAAEALSLQTDSLINRYPKGRDTSTVSTKQIQGDLIGLDSAVDRVLGTETLLSSLIAFSDPGTVKMVARWMCLRDLVENAYESDGRKLIFKGPFDDHHLYLPSGLQMPDYQRLKHLRDMIWEGSIEGLAA